MVVAHNIGVYIGNGYRMRRGEGSRHDDDDTPVRRSARQAGRSPEPLPPHPPQSPTPDQMMRMFEEKRNQDLMEFLRSMQTIVGQKQNQGPGPSFQTSKEPTHPVSARQMTP